MDLVNNNFGEFEIKDEREPNSVEQERTETAEPVGCLFSVGSLDRRTNVVPQFALPELTECSIRS